MHILFSYLLKKVMGDSHLTSIYSVFNSKLVPNPQALGYVLGKTLGIGTYAEVVEAKLKSGKDKVKV